MKKFRYGKPVDKNDLPKPKRLPEYDECLSEFIDSGHETWIVNKEALPSKDNGVILSSLKWRIKHKPERFGKIRVFMRKNQIYLQRQELDDQ
jgi:hypothetical protein